MYYFNNGQQREENIDDVRVHNMINAVCYCKKINV